MGKLLKIASWKMKKFNTSCSLKNLCLIFCFNSENVIENSICKDKLWKYDLIQLISCPVPQC